MAFDTPRVDRTPLPAHGKHFSLAKKFNYTLNVRLDLAVEVATLRARLLSALLQGRVWNQSVDTEEGWNELYRYVQVCPDYELLHISRLIEVADSATEILEETTMACTRKETITWSCDHPRCDHTEESGPMPDGWVSVAVRSSSKMGKHDLCGSCYRRIQDGLKGATSQDWTEALGLPDGTTPEAAQQIIQERAGAAYLDGLARRDKQYGDALGLAEEDRFPEGARRVCVERSSAGIGPTVTVNSQERGWAEGAQITDIGDLVVNEADGSEEWIKINDHKIRRDLAIQILEAIEEGFAEKEGAQQ